MVAVSEGIRLCDYLKLGVDERINYRASKGVSYSDLFDSWMPDPIKGRKTLASEVRKYFGLSESCFYRLVKKGFFGESIKDGNNRYFSVRKINQIARAEALFVPAGEFYEFIKEGVYLSRSQFDVRYKRYFRRGVRNKIHGFDYKDAARIFSELHSRREIVERWATLKELNTRIRDYFTLDRGPSEEYLRNLLKGREGVVRSKYVSPGRISGRPAYKIHPILLGDLIASEVVKISNLDRGVRTRQIAEQLGVSSGVVSVKINRGTALGIVHPLNVKGYSFGSVGYVLDPNEAEDLIMGNRKIPGRRTFAALMQERKLAKGNGQRLEVIGGGLLNLRASLERKLWKLARSGNDEALKTLIDLFSNLFPSFQEDYVTSAVFDFANRGNLLLPREGRVQFVRACVADRAREERVSWQSLDNRIKGNDGEIRFADLFSERGY